MSLRIWLPLNGDIHNQGISDIQPQLMGNGVTWTAGKIGQAATFPNNCNSCIYMPGLKLQIFSWACWLKCTGEGSTSSQRVLSEGRDYGDYHGTNIFLSKTGTTLYVEAHKKTLTTAIQLNQWYHVVMACDGSKLFFYLNGNLINSVAYTEDSLYNDSNDTFVLGKMSYGYTNTNNYFPFNGQLNDVRIYDHCLSLKEVKEISQGLVLHYKLNGPIGGVNNNLLLANESTYINNLQSFELQGWVMNLFTKTWMNEHLTVGQTYTLSYKATCVFRPEGTWTKTETRVMPILVHQGGGMNQSTVCTGTKTTDMQVGESKEFITTFKFATITETQEYYGLCMYTMLFNNGSSGNQFSKFKIENLKLEEGTQKTPWTPHIITLGINDTMIIDSSGYNHNGTTLNTITTSFDTPRYNLSTNLINADSAINCGRSGMVTDSITVNFWCKQSSWGNPVSCTEGGGWNMENNGGSLTFPVYIAGIGYVHSKNGSTANQIAPATLNNNWHMLTGVYDRIGQKVQLYIDGELEQENTVSSPNLISYHGGNVIWIGAEASGSATSPAGNGMVGLFSDFRIYCTALSAEDIKELYQVSASIDKLGNIHTYDFNENDLNNISDTGILHSSQINESNFSKYLKYDPNVYIEPDGSCWLHIYHHNNPSLGSFASTNDFEHGVYIDDNRWFNVNVCNYLNKWELMVKGKFTSTSNEWKIRWIQSVNPMVATFAQVAAANVTKITTNGYLSSPNNWGGLYAKKGSTYLSANNGTNGNWWGAVGSYSVYQGGIPGWGYQGNTPVTTTGFNDLYVRIDNVDFDNINNVSNNKNKIWTANQFIEK